jgi:UDP-N-acetylglucosamine acyltransferase
VAHIHHSATIHPAALIGDNTHIGEHVQIAAYASVADDVYIGAHSRIDSFACVLQYTRMGSGNHIYSHALVGGTPQDLRFNNEITWLEIGDNNRIREFSTLHRGTAAGCGITRVHSNTLIMAYAHVAHDCQVGNSVVMSNNATLGGHVHVGDFAVLGGLSAVHQYCRIGHYAFLGGASAIGQDLPPYMLATGHRAKILSPNLVGLRRLGVSPELIRALKAAYRLIWHSEQPRKEALEELKEEFGTMPEIQSLIDFINTSDRGIAAAGRDTE